MTTVVDWSAAMRVTVPAARSLTYTAPRESTASPRGWRKPRAQTLTGARAAGALPALGAWATPGTHARNPSAAIRAEREARAGQLVDLLVM
jgi:hypothetical protein